MKKICVYTCITGNYDGLNDPEVVDKNIDYICFTNNKNLKSSIWKIILIEDFKLSNYMLSRKIKILGHPIINDNYDISVWIDGSIIIKKSIRLFLKQFCDINKYDFASFKHSQRDCIYDEGTACVRLKKDTKENIKKTLDFYTSIDFPKHYGLYEMTVFVRNVKSKIVSKTMKLWFEMINTYSKRDQMSFMYCVYKTNLKINTIDLDIWNNDWFKSNSHKTIEPRENFRAYFGDSKDFDIRNVVDGKYEINSNKYIANILIPTNSTRIEFECTHTPGILLKKMKTSGSNITNEKIYNIYNVNNNIIFYNTDGIILFEGIFKKNEKLSIEFEFDELSKEDLLNMLNKEHESKTILSNKLDSLTNEYDAIKNELSKILNSKSWRIINKMRRIIKKISRR